MKKKLIFTIILVIFFSTTVHASSGALKKNSIKKCPDGLTYGYHGKDKHWHRAEQANVNSGWAAIGDTFYYDPCPNNDDGSNKKIENTTGNNNNQKSASTNKSTEKAENNQNEIVSKNVDDENKSIQSTSSGKENDYNNIAIPNEELNQNTESNPSDENLPTTAPGILGVALLLGGALAYKKRK